ncbi:MAG: hypothetical protein ABI763_17495 [Bacteroidota bacterium]
MNQLVYSSEPFRNKKKTGGNLHEIPKLSKKFMHLLSSIATKT